MGNITWHHAKGLDIESLHVNYEKLVRTQLGLVEKTPSKLGLLSRNALNLSLTGLLLGQPIEGVIDSLQLACQAKTAIMCCAISNGQYESVLGGVERQFVGEVDNSYLTPTDWIEAYFLSIISNEYQTIAVLDGIDTNKLRDSSSVSPDYKFYFVDALKAFYKNDESMFKHIVKAIDLTDPETNDLKAVDWALNIDVPLLQNLFYVASHDVAFDGNFYEANQLHKKYWSAKSRSNDIKGFVSIGLTSLAVFARQAGLEFEESSDYTPKKIIDFQFDE